MNAIPNGFTQDVLLLMNQKTPVAPSARAALEADGVTRAEAPEVIKRGICCGLRPVFDNPSVPDFVKQIVARALLQEVDWGYVAGWAWREDS